MPIKDHEVKVTAGKSTKVLVVSKKYYEANKDDESLVLVDDTELPEMPPAKTPDLPVPPTTEKEPSVTPKTTAKTKVPAAKA